MWECGLKQIEWSARLRISVVTPYVGVWIETECRRYIACEEEVTPYVGVWIETQLLTKMMSFMASLLMWECGLKLTINNELKSQGSHSLCGSVD